MFNSLKKILNKFGGTFVTRSERTPEFFETRDISAPQDRDMAPKKLVMESLCCPYCQSTTYVKKGFRMKKREKVQLFLCLSCRKVFTPRSTKGKHYPLAIMLDAISIYNLGYSLEQTCRIVSQRHQKTTLSSGSLTDYEQSVVAPDLSTKSIALKKSIVKKDVDPTGIAPVQPDLTDPVRHLSGPTPNPVYIIDLQPSTLSNWLSETSELCRFSRMREFALKKFSPKEMVITATLAHRQMYRFRFHRAKADLMIKEEYQHRKFVPLQEFLEMVPVECPHQYFQEGLRASETPLTFSKTAMIVRGKTNYATRLAAFVLQSVTDRKARHEAIQKFMLANDSVTVATEVPVYLTRDDIEHMKSQLGFEIFPRVITTTHSVIPDPTRFAKSRRVGDPSSLDSRVRGNDKDTPAADTIKLPKLITGHIDILQIRNGQIHILDYKPKAAKERPIEQLTLYAMALSRLTGLRLFEFKCAWFDESDYFEFYPLHVLHKPKKAQRRRNVMTQEGIYNVNKHREKIERIRPL